MSYLHTLHFHCKASYNLRQHVCSVIGIHGALHGRIQDDQISIWLMLFEDYSYDQNNSIWIFVLHNYIEWIVWLMKPTEWLYSSCSWWLPIVLAVNHMEIELSNILNSFVQKSPSMLLFPFDLVTPFVLFISQGNSIM